MSPNQKVSDSTQRPHIQSVQRALEILQVFNQGRPELGVTELSKELMLSKAVIFRLLATMEQFGFIEQNPQNRKYHLGRTVFKIAAVYASQNDLCTSVVVFCVS